MFMWQLTVPEHYNTDSWLLYPHMNQITHSEDAMMPRGPPKKNLESIEVFSLNITTVELYGLWYANNIK